MNLTAPNFICWPCARSRQLIPQLDLAVKPICSESHHAISARTPPLQNPDPLFIDPPSSCKQPPQNPRSLLPPSRSIETAATARNAAGNARVPRSGGRDGEPAEASRDRISELPDSLLHLILVLVPLVDAVRTCVLSRRWRGLWRRLPLLFFDDVQAPRVSRFRGLVEAVLRGYADDVDMGDLFVSVYRRDTINSDADADDPVRFAATVAGLAAPRVSGRFCLYLSPAAVNLYPENDADGYDDDEVSLRLPCFPRATELSLTFTGVNLGMPPPATDTFAKLTKLFLAGVRFTDGGAEISHVVSSRCPCIQRLELHRIRGLRLLTVFAGSLVSMVLSRILVLDRLLVAAANLRHMLVDRCFVLSNTQAFMFLGVPALEQLLWQDRCPEVIRHWVLPSCLRRLVVAELDLSYLLAGGCSGFARILQLFKRVETLRLEFPTSQDPTDQENLIENVNLPCYSELDFMVNHTRHKFGPTILNLLRKCSCVKKVTLQMFVRDEVGYIPCPSNCNCRRLSVWTDKAINLDSLEWVAMYEFRATQDEKSFIYYIMRNARHLRKVSVVFSLDANPTRRFFRKLCYSY